MDIQPFTERVDEETSLLQMMERCRNYLNGNRALWLQTAIPRQQEILAAARAERQEVLDNPHRLYWKKPSLILPQMQFFRQFKYLPYAFTKPDLDSALDACITDCAQEVQQMLNEFGSVKVWLTIQVRYEPVNPNENNRNGFEQYLSCVPICFFRHVADDNGIIAPYEQEFHLLADRIKQHNANYIRDKSGLVLAGISQLVLRGVKYAPLAGRGYQELPKFLQSKKAILNIRNTDNRCFGYAILYFKNRPDAVNHFERPNHYTEQMF